MFEKLKEKLGGKAGEKAVKRRIADKLHDVHIKRIAEKGDDGVETIIARECHINRLGEKGEELCATEGVRTVFRAAVDEMRIWEFMSLDGCVIGFVNLDTGKERNVVVYYDRRLER